jgi:hypothetical protein
MKEFMFCIRKQITDTLSPPRHLEFVKSCEQYIKEVNSIYYVNIYRNNEYFRLVFPLATKLNIPYLYPIDDLSTWKEYEKYDDRLQVVDTTDAEKIEFHKYTEDFSRKLKSLPKDSNQWVFVKFRTNYPRSTLCTRLYNR